MDETQKRLITLYAFSSVNVRISKDQIASVLLNNTSLSWFDLQLTLNSLLKDNLISINDKTNKLALTFNGDQVVKIYSNDIPEEIRNNIDKYVKENRDELLREFTVSSNFKKQEFGYRVELKITENNLDLIDLKLSTPTRQLAEKICQSFKEKPNELYKIIINTLSQ